MLLKWPPSRAVTAAGSASRDAFVKTPIFGLATTSTFSRTSTTTSSRLGGRIEHVGFVVVVS